MPKPEYFERIVTAVTHTPKMYLVEVGLITFEFSQRFFRGSDPNNGIRFVRVKCFGNGHEVVVILFQKEDTECHGAFEPLCSYGAVTGV